MPRKTEEQDSIESMSHPHSDLLLKNSVFLKSNNHWPNDARTVCNDDQDVRRDFYDSHTAATKDIRLEMQYGEKNLRLANAYQQHPPELAIQMYPSLLHVYAKKWDYITQAGLDSMPSASKTALLSNYDAEVISRLMENNIPTATKSQLDAVHVAITSKQTADLQPQNSDVWNKPGSRDYFIRNQEMASQYQQKANYWPDLDLFPELLLYMLATQKYEEQISNRNEQEKQRLMNIFQKETCKQIERGIKPSMTYTPHELHQMDVFMESMLK